MPSCPKCKAEYAENFSFCRNCNVKLVKHQESEVFIDLGPATILTNVPNEHEANFIESVLIANNIPFFRQHTGAGSYLTIEMGMSNFGIDIFVPESLVEKAKELINMFDYKKIQETAGEVAREDQYTKRRKNRVWFIVALSWIPFLIIMIIEWLYKTFFVTIQHR